MAERRLVTSSPGNFNFQELLDKLSGATNVMITTYGLGNCCDGNPVLKALREKKRDGHITLMVCVPNRVLDESETSERKTDQDMQRYIEAMNAERFPCPIDVWFCFENHAKIIVADTC